MFSFPANGPNRLRRLLQTAPIFCRFGEASAAFMVSKIGSRTPQGVPKTCPRTVEDANLRAPDSFQIQPIWLKTPHPTEAHFLGRFWEAPATLIEAKIAPRTLQDAFFSYHFLGCLFGRIFDQFLIASCLQLASNLLVKIDKNL